MADPRPKSFDSKWAIAQFCNPLAVARVVAVPKAMSRAASRRWYKIASLTSLVEQTPMPGLRRVIKLRSDGQPRPGSARTGASHVVEPDAPDVAQLSPSFVLRLTSLGAGGGRTCRSRTRASVCDHNLACGRGRRRPS